MSDPLIPDKTSLFDRKHKLALVAIVFSGAALVISIVTLVLEVTGPKQEAASINDFNERVRAYMMASPETLIEALNELETRQKVAEGNEITRALTDRQHEIFSDPSSPSVGDPNGDVTLVEFFDYNCPYCRKAAPILDELLKADRRIRFAF